MSEDKNLDNVSNDNKIIAIGFKEKELWNDRLEASFNKKLDNIFNKNKMVVISFEEKHSTETHIAIDKEEFKNVCLETVWRRYQDGYWYAKPEEVEDVPSLTKEQVEALPDGNPKKVAAAEWDDYEKQLQFNNQDLFIFNLIEEALRTRNGLIAFDVLYQRKSYQYEGFKIEECSKQKELPEGNLLEIKP